MAMLKGWGSPSEGRKGRCSFARSFVESLIGFSCDVCGLGMLWPVYERMTVYLIYEPHCSRAIRSPQSR